MKRFHLPLLVCAAAIAALTLQGCAANSSPEWDSRFGDSVRQLKAQQLIDPAAPERNAEAKAGVDGRSAREARDRYVESYAKPAASTVTVGGTGAAQ